MQAKPLVIICALVAGVTAEARPQAPEDGGLHERIRSFVSGQLQRRKVDRLTFLASDDAPANYRRRGFPISRTLDYRDTAAENTEYFTFWLTRDGREADVLFSGE
jgi:hypothetical protein